MQPNVPREKVPWFPILDLDACIGDQECLKFCKNDVFVWDELNSCPVVEKPFNCVLGCSACEQICPAEAISFPSKEELRRVLRALREQSAAGAVSPFGSGHDAE